MTKKWNEKKHKCKCGGTGCGQRRTFPLFPEITLNVKNLHLHFDEHMNSTSFYQNGSDRCTGKCCKEDFVEIDLQALTEKIARNSGVALETVRKVLDTEHTYLRELRVCETMEKGKESDKTQSGIHLQEDSTESEDESNEE
mgnify:FL=1